MAATLTIHGTEYDVEKDFSWGELMLVEELSGVPLGAPNAFDAMAVLGACVFVVMKRTDAALAWEDFVKQPMMLNDEREEADESARVNRAAKRAAKQRPPKRAA